MAFVIAYDISHPRRLRRVARLLERRAVRCQYSVFVFDGTAEQLVALMNELGALLRPDEDVVQTWPVPRGVSPDGVARGVVRPVSPAAVVVSGRRPLLIHQPPPTSNEEQV